MQTWPLRCWLVVAAAPFVLAAPIASGAPACASSDPPAVVLVCKINNLRSDNGLQTLRWNGQLADLANGLASDMAQSGNLSHVDSQGRDLPARVAASNYLTPDGGGIVEENIAMADGDLATPQAVIDDWMQSDVHRAQMLDPRVTDIAAAVARSAHGTFFTAEFGVNGAIQSEPAGEQAPVSRQGRRHSKRRARRTHGSARRSLRTSAR